MISPRLPARTSPIGAEFWPAAVALVLAVSVGTLLPMYGQTLVVAPVLGLVLVGVIWRWPLAGVAGTVTLTSTVFAYGALPRIGLSGASLYLPEVLVLVLLVRTLVTSRTESAAPRAIRLPDVAFAGLLFASAVSVLVDWLARGQPIVANLTQARWMALYALYFITRQLLREDGAAFKRLVFALLGIGAITAIVFDLAVLTGVRDILQSYSWFSLDTFDLYVNATTDSIQGGRVYMPGRALVQVLFLPALVGAIVSPPGKFRRISLGLTLLFGLTIILIFTRMVWLTTMITVGILGLFISRHQRAGLVKIAAWSAAPVIIASVVLGFSTSWSTASPLETFLQRFGTVFSDNVQDQDAQYRIDEAQATLTRAAESPVAFVVGSGFLATVRTVETFDRLTGEPVFQEIGTGHNGYLSLLLNTGLIGLASFLVLSGLIVRACWQARTQQPSQNWFIWAITLGFALTLLRILLNGVSESTFTDSFTVPLVAVAFALVERGLAENGSQISN